MKPCTIDGCDRPLLARGWCSLHYKRWKRNGDPMVGERFVPMSRVCSVDGCDKPLECKGLCPQHYTRWRKFGDVHALTHTPRRDPSENFWQRVEQTDPSACWAWQGSIARGGYGRFAYWDGVRPRMVSAHRFAYMDRVGPIPDGLHLDHLCRNRACVNPTHLEPVTPAENARRGAVARRGVA